ncbi:MAG: helix-turn-helix domain-containing protein [Myxococcota bacterium]
MTRAYKSEVREAQLAETREHLLTQTHELLASEGLDGLTLPRLAVRAEVSVPTVYRHFATLDDLLLAFLAWMRPRVGMSMDDLYNREPGTLAALPLENFPRFEANRAVLEPLMESRAWNRVRVGSMVQRTAKGAELLQSLAPQLSEADRVAASGALFLLGTPQSWRWLKETWGLEADAAARASSWAMGVLLEALGTTRGILAPAPVDATAAAPPSPSKRAASRGATTKKSEGLRSRRAPADAVGSPSDEEGCPDSIKKKKRG